MRSKPRGALGDLLGAVSFLTRVPTGTGAVQPAEMARFVPWFPLVGALVGAAVGGLYAGASALLPPLAAAAVAVTAGVAVTGAFHEDGLGDTADAFVGGVDREDTLRILEDPRLGTFGVVGHALLRSVCGYNPARVVSFAGRFSSPVFPGETIRTEFWRDGNVVSFRALVPERNIVVMNNGRAEVRG